MTEFFPFKFYSGIFLINPVMSLILTDMETPKSSSRRIKPRKYVPTPKMAERKKALFTPRSSERSPSISLEGDSDDDSDLGIMSPLQCSSSPSRYDSDGKIFLF